MRMEAEDGSEEEEMMIRSVHVVIRVEFAVLIVTSFSGLVSLLSSRLSAVVCSCRVMLLSSSLRYRSVVYYVVILISQSLPCHPVYSRNVLYHPNWHPHGPAGI